MTFGRENRENSDSARYFAFLGPPGAGATKKIRGCRFLMQPLWFFVLGFPLLLFRLPQVLGTENGGLACRGPKASLVSGTSIL